MTLDIVLLAALFVLAARLLVQKHWHYYIMQRMSESGRWSLYRGPYNAAKVEKKTQTDSPWSF